MYQHPRIEDLIIEDTKQLGVNFEINLDKQESNLTYAHWANQLEENIFSKRSVAKSYASAWNPLHEMGPLTNSDKVCLSKIWKLQTFVKQSLIQNRGDLKERNFLLHF